MIAQQMTDRQQSIKELLDEDIGAREIAEKLGITRNAVYQQIQRMRRNGVLDENYTPSGQPLREERKIEVPLGDGRRLYQRPEGASVLDGVQPGDVRRACIEVMQELQGMQLRMNQLVVELARFLATSE